MDFNNELNELTHLFSNIKLNKPNEEELLHIELNKINKLIYKINEMKKGKIMTIKDYMKITNMENKLQKLINNWNREEQLQNEQQEYDIYDYYQSI